MLAFLSVISILTQGKHSMVDKFVYTETDDDGQKKRAQNVFNCFLDDAYDIPVDEGMSVAQYMLKVHEVEQKVIRDNLDHESIFHFMNLILKHGTSVTASIKAGKRHSASRANKAKVFYWCDDNMHLHDSMDDAAWDIAETFVPEKFRAVRDWMTEWKKLRSASTP
ncbi:hypothetical protein Rfer_2831 [Rhodoferax ferrireducens T118]|uniref:Uncharacterized protein n=2 Tax=Rhodoferax ferrireducens TaxID=192843 RepID=Q21UL0_ALBFT|nr:hypothetical protein Rfer_2831 [Rhodoferax ferrireducens T118]